MRWATLVLLSLVACSDLREFQGTWTGPLNNNPHVLAGIFDTAGVSNATLAIDEITSHTLAARLSIPGILPETAIATMPQAEADALSDITFAGAPLKVYLAFTPMPDGGGDALAVIALYDDRRVEVRMVRGGSRPLYGIFALSEFAP